MSWYIEAGPDSDVIISSRVRLARNLSRYPFPHRMDIQQARQAAEEIVQAFYLDDAERKRHYLLVDLDTLSREDGLALAEKRLISEDLASAGQNHKAIISRDETVSIMINEEDHIRIQSMQAGLRLEQAYEAAAQAALVLEQTLSLAYSDKYGFLTACPTNTGTGMRASVMAHLLALTMTGKIKNTIDGLIKLGFTVRGHYGEHSKSQGNLFQISNQLTLGISEEDLINDLKRMLQQLIEQERDIRREVYRRQPIVLEDKIMRAFGVLKSARLISNEEAAGLLSDLRLGLALGLLSGLQETDINRLYAAIGPASIQKAHGQAMSSEERDQARAKVIRGLLEHT
ncbi:MAG: protein arginine kinase [Ruminococcaceae bacterium]|nr:protein arginine kinase [Oscillospiraceae bacterium]